MIATPRSPAGPPIPALTSPVPPEPRAPVDRQSELAAIASMLDGAERGYGGLVLLFGPAGMGRSTLIEAAVAGARARAFTTRSARGSLLERDYPFGVTRQLLRSVIAGMAPEDQHSLFAGAAARAREPLGFTGSAEASQAAYTHIEALQCVAERVACRRPLVLAVDDLQWCDRATLDFLCYLGRRSAELPVVIVAAWCRGEPQARAGRMQALAGERDTVFLNLRPLNASGIAELIRRERGADGDPMLVEACLERTRGVPFLVVELLRAVASARTDDLLNRMRSAAPETVRRDVTARLARHPTRSRRLAESVAVLGERIPLRRACELADLADDEGRVAADALVRAGLLAHEGGLSYTAPLLRDAVYGALSPLDRAALHSTAARLLMAAGEDLEAARHLLHVEPERLPEVGDLLFRAGGRARRLGALQASRGYLRRALAEQDGDVWDGAAYAELGEVELELGRPHEALAALTSAASLTDDPVKRVARSILAADAADAVHGLPGAVAVLARARSDAPAKDGACARELMAREALLRMCDEPDPRVASTMTLSDRLDPDHLSDNELSVVLSADVLGARSTADQIARRCVTALGRCSPLDQARGVEPFYLLCRSALSCGYPDIVDDALAQLEIPDDTWHPAAECVRAALSVQLAVGRGDLSSAEPACTVALRGVEAQPSTSFWRRVRRELLIAVAVIDLERDRRESAWAALSQCGEEPSGSADIAVFCLWLRLLVSEARGAEALPTLMGAAGSSSMGVTACGLAWQPLAARAYAQAGELEHAALLADEHLERMLGWGSLSAHADALLTRAVVEDDTERGLALMRDAVALLDRTDSPLAQARGHVELGSLLRRAGQRVAAREELVIGADQAHHCGAVALGHRARSELVVIGARPRRGAFSGIDSLTAGERRVAELAADGMTNRQIAASLTVSMKTVSSQLTAVYRKLDINSRATLAAVVRAGQAESESTDGGWS